MKFFEKIAGIFTGTAMLIPAACAIIAIPAEAQTNVFGSATPAVLAEYEIELGGNAYVTRGNGATIDNDAGLVKWSERDAVISTFFRTSHSQKKVKLALNAKGHSTIAINAAGKTVRIALDSDDFKEYELGEFDFPEPGYQKIRIRGKEKTGAEFGEIRSVFVKGIVGNVNYVSAFSPYFGRRGPSVHFRYELPRTVKLEYFYNEITVPEGGDPVGSYFMLNGFDYGYSGIQVNSPTERRVLFSVWSPFSTDDPKSIPENMRVVNLRRGEGVHIGEFGNEGSGGQSFLRYPWKAGETYGILTRVRPDGEGNTDYTAYFYVPAERKWHLIASFRRPKTNTWYAGAHSFLENFSPLKGHLTREVHFGNQWVCDVKGNWYELTKGRFTCDETGRAKVRLDFAGGITKDGDEFFLRNCGFFNETVEPGTTFERKSSGKKPPMINFSALEKL